jgi:hypothetical protein
MAARTGGEEVTPPLPTHQVAAMLAALGLDADFADLDAPGPMQLHGVVKPELVARLRQDARFQAGLFVPYHGEIGVPRIEFRSHRGVLPKGSLQICINPETGRCYVDIDKHPATSDVVGFLGHFFGEVLPHRFRRT